MKMINTKIVLSSLAAVAMLTGCGGGGGSSGGGSSGGTALVFPANAVSAEATNENAQEVATSIEGGKTIDVSNMNLSVTQADTKSVGGIDTINKMIKNIDLAKISSKTSSGLNEVYNESETFDCSNTGTQTYSYNININESTGDISGTVTASMNNCDGDNGSLSIEYGAKVNMNTEELESISKMNFTVGSSGYSYDTGSLSAASTISLSNVVVLNGDLTSYSMLLNFIATEGNKKYGAQDLAVNINDNGTYLTTNYVSGKVYINDLNSFVTASGCTTPIKEQSWGTSYVEGLCLFNGAGNSKIKLYVSGAALWYAVDPDGDGTFEAGQAVEE